MRLWSLHPRYLDPQGLVALWREALLAQAVLRGETKGYRNHPQLDRFKAHPAPLVALGAYLRAVHKEATSRGYAFDGGKIVSAEDCEGLPVTLGQLGHEFQHLLMKLALRSPAWHERWRGLACPEPHPLFRPCPGPVEPWERVPPGAESPDVSG